MRQHRLFQTLFLEQYQIMKDSQASSAIKCSNNLNNKRNKTSFSVQNIATKTIFKLPPSYMYKKGYF